jgi:hypothetical protein
VQDIQERSNGVARRLPNFGLLNEGIVEERDGALLLLVHAAAGIAAFGLFPGGCAGDVEPHLGELIPPGRRLPALPRCRAILAVRFAAIGN